MRLSEKNKEELRELVAEVLKDGLGEFIKTEVNKAVWEALTVEIHLEKARDPETGQPLAHKEIVKEDIFLPSFIAQHLKFHEGAFRGLQETADRQKNRMNKAFGASMAVRKQVEMMGKLFANFEKPLMLISRFAAELERTGLLEQMEAAAAIEYNPEAE